MPSVGKIAAKSPVCPELTPVYEALVRASNAMPALAGDLDMQLILLNAVEVKLHAVIEAMSRRKDQGEHE